MNCIAYLNILCYQSLGENSITAQTATEGHSLYSKCTKARMYCITVMLVLLCRAVHYRSTSTHLHNNFRAVQVSTLVCPHSWGEGGLAHRPLQKSSLGARGGCVWGGGVRDEPNSTDLQGATVDSPQIGQVLKVTGYCGDGRAVTTYCMRS
jgi:hypothetical protein